MHNIYVEKYVCRDDNIYNDIALHIYARHSAGQIVIVTEHPKIMLSVLCKGWRRVIKLALKEKSSTLDHTRINELTNRISQMQQTQITYVPPINNDQAGIFLMSLEQAKLTPPNCVTLYLTQDTPRTVLGAITTNMPQNSLVVFCQKKLTSKRRKTIKPWRTNQKLQ